MTDNIKPYNARFWSKVSIGNGCWEWTASTKGNGYGQFREGGKTLHAHRVAYREWYGHDPKVVCHQCDNRLCVRPSHMVDGDASRNGIDRAQRQGGHKLTAEQAASIRQDKRPRAEVAEEFGITTTMVGYIQRGDWWNHV